MGGVTLEISIQGREILLYQAVECKYKGVYKPARCSTGLSGIQTRGSVATGPAIDNYHGKRLAISINYVIIMRDKRFLAYGVCANIAHGMFRKLHWDENQEIKGGCSAKL